MKVLHTRSSCAEVSCLFLPLSKENNLSTSVHVCIISVGLEENLPLHVHVPVTLHFGKIMLS